MPIVLGPKGYLLARMCQEQSLSDAPSRSTATRPPCPPDFGNLPVRFRGGSRGNLRNELVENLEHTGPLTFAQASDTVVVLEYSVTDNLALGFAKPGSGIL